MDRRIQTDDKDSKQQADMKTSSSHCVCYYTGKLMQNSSEEQIEMCELGKMTYQLSFSLLRSLDSRTENSELKTQTQTQKMSYSGTHLFNELLQ